MEERRQFSRIVLDWPVEIIQHGERWPSTLIDLSFKGVLLNCERIELEPNATIRIHLHIPQSQLDLEFKAHLLRQNGSVLAFVIDALDIESMSELRRVIELNLGDEGALHREMEQLLAVR
ncbi:PilZ domain-containing protein [Echinimonas agarilytica]|uniref:Cyclic diguanosine monophosphate-binding protein n=2 Tax=Echinimonas agarilytica TaxID=1215918 RepID=A0AA42B7T1_9GAMM|nr:PilZ domain-containing protein [Echinimonas agarilytica]MCM2680530.1 PilZ domain-containing protein [Echinimonas agarilytica]